MTSEAIDHWEIPRGFIAAHPLRIDLPDGRYHVRFGNWRCAAATAAIVAASLLRGCPICDPAMSSPVVAYESSILPAGRQNIGRGMP